MTDDHSIYNAFPVTDPSNHVGKIMRIVAEVVGIWKAAENKTLCDEDDAYVYQELTKHGCFAKLQELLVLYGNGSEAPKGMMQLKSSKLQSSELLSSILRKPWSGPHWPDGRNGWCKDVNCEKCNELLFGSR